MPWQDCIAAQAFIPRHRPFTEVVLICKFWGHTISLILSTPYSWLIVILFALRFSNMTLQLIAGFYYLGNGIYHNALFRLISVLCLMCIQPCLGVRLNLYKQDPILTAVPAGLATNITDLSLRGNEISELGADNFTGLSSVVIIDLTGNRIAHIDNHAFLSCVALSDLRLGSNRLTSMPSTFGPNTPYMSSLFIGQNPCVIDNSYFRQFRSLQTLHMADVGMREFPDDFFTGLISLETLLISHTKAPNLTEKTVSLDNFKFNHHIGSSFPDENFLNLRNLRKVVIFWGDHMTSVPRFLGATGLQEIELLSFTVDSIPDLSHLTSLSKLLFTPTKVICDHRLCWTLFESFTFSLSWLDRPGCFSPQKFRFRSIYSISKLELSCFDSKFIMQGATKILHNVD